MFKSFGETKKITEKLYEQNLELAVKNKTLSLLEKLYRTSVLTLTPEEMAREITDTVCKDLNLELAGVLIFKKEADSLTPLAFSESERLVKTLNELGFFLQDIKITDVSKHDFLKQVAYNETDGMTNSLQEVWGGLINKDHLAKIKKESHIKTILLYPLIINKEVFGMLLLGLNRNYNTLNTFEKTSIKSFINVIALLLDKAYLHKNLQDSYEITKRAYAEVDRLSKAKSEFISIASHQLRTPLSAIKGYISMLVEGTYGKVSEKAKRPLANVYESNQRLINLVNNLLDISRLEAGRMELEPEAVQIEEVIEGVIQELKITAEQKKLELKWEKPTVPLPKVLLDKDKMRQVFLNLVQNAIKYTKEGSITIRQSVSNNKLLVVVQDTGEGMTKEDLGKLFETFSRGTIGVQIAAEGAGLGLYIARKFVEMHKGRVWAESEGEGKGSTFYVELAL